MPERTVEELNREFVINGRRLRITLVIATSLSILLLILSIFFILQNQQQISEQIKETKRQGVINQKYIRCIILIPADTFRGDVQQRTKAIDKCAIESRLP